jgi:hypothetical protein
MTDPYREMVLVKPKPASGLIQAPKPAKRHQCNKPVLFLRRLLFWLPTIRYGSLWRCAECKSVFFAAISFPDSNWLATDLDTWISQGGSK